MKIKLKFFGFPEVEPIMGEKEINLEFEGHTYDE
jgi:hypothetical protein